MSHAEAINLKMLQLRFGIWIFSFCQLSLWGAALKPSSKDVSCAFILNQLTGALITTTTNLTSTLTGTLGGTLDSINLLGQNSKNKDNNNRQPKPNAVENGRRKQTNGKSSGGGLLGLGRGQNGENSNSGGGGLLGVL